MSSSTSLLSDYIVYSAQIEDSNAIHKLFVSKTLHYIGHLTDLSMTKRFTRYQNLRLILMNKQNLNEILGYIEVRGHPHLPALPNDCWLNLLKHRYCLTSNLKLPISLCNTLFLNFIIYDSSYSLNVIQLLINEVFHRSPKLRYLIVIKPPYTHDEKIKTGLDYSLLDRLATTYYPYDFNGMDRKITQTLNIIERRRVIYEIQFRKALPEDNDDVIEIIDFEEPERHREMGDFYIAEELLRLDEDAKLETLVIGETDEHQSGLVTTGFLWLSINIDLKCLIKQYDLESFGNLVRYTNFNPHSVVHIEVNSAEFKPYNRLFTDVALHDLAEAVILGGLMVDTSLASVVSHAKIQFSSDCGELSTNLDNFYERERLFTKFRYIYEDMRRQTHYYEARKKQLEIKYDVMGPDTDENCALNQASNVFQLNMLALNPNQRFEVAYEYLGAAFCAYPTRDYCLMRLDPKAKQTDSTTELLKYFLRVNPRPGLEIPDDLYITHRCSLFGDLNIFELLETDVDRVKEMLYYGHCTRSTMDSVSPVPNEAFYVSDYFYKRIINELIEDYFSNAVSDFRILSICCGQSQNREDNTFVGFIVLREFRDYDSIMKIYMLPRDDFKSSKQRAEIIMLKLHPLFHIWSDELFRIIACKTNFQEFFFIENAEDLPLPNDIIKNMMPVEPNPLKKNLFVDVFSARFYRKLSQSAALPRDICIRERLIVFRHNLLPTKFFGNKQSIVIIGFSEICKAFLRMLAFDWNDKDYTYSKVYNCVPNLNVTVITGPGIIEGEYDSEFVCSHCSNSRECYIGTVNNGPYVRDCTHRLDLRHWVHFVTGEVKQIDCKNKIVELMNQCSIPYDTLLILCHMDFGIRARSSIQLHLPYNYVQINRRLDKIIMYHKLQEMHDNELSNTNILIYGSSLSTYECINFLLNHGIDGVCITLVVPPVTNNMDGINDPSIDDNISNILLEMVRDEKITVYKGANYKNWTRYQYENAISFVNFKFVRNGELFSIKCDLFINFSIDYLDLCMEKVLKQSGIHMAGKSILVDQNYRTNDTSIYAMGKHIKMRDKPNFQYTHTNENEAADKLMRILGLSKNKAPVERKYLKPYTYVAKLPLGYLLMKIVLPKRNIPDVNGEVDGETMTTFDGEFCRVRLDEYRIVEEITIMSNKLVASPYYLEYFCGKHEALLNGLYLRWCRGLITNFLEFFQEPWTELIMHSRFEELQAKNKQSMEHLLKESGAFVCITNLETLPNSEITQSDRFIMKKKEILEGNLLYFLRKYEKDFVNEFVVPK